MYISKLRIRNFRNFSHEPFSIDLKPFTLILGENNIGKTNMLAAISLLFSQEVSTVQQRNLQLDDINYLSVSEFKKQIASPDVEVDKIIFPEVEIHIVLTDIQEEQHPVVGDWYCNTDLTEACITYRFSVRGNFKRDKWIEEQRKAIAHRKKEGENSEKDYSQYIDFPIEEYRYTIYGGGRPANECESWLLRMIRADLLSALRDAKQELVPGGEQRLLFRILRQRSDSQYTGVKALLDDLKKEIDEEPSLSLIKNDVQDLLAQVSLKSPDEKHLVDLQFAQPDTIEILKRIGMIYGENPISVDRNGLGRNNLLYIALVLSQLAKAPDISSEDDNFVCFRFVGIEEPEAHLHPHLQNHLAGNIENIREKHSDTLQLILTSHSTHVAAKLALENTVVLFQSETGNSLAAHYILDGIDPVKNKNTIRFLSLYLDATKSCMFFARRLILVEGISEQAVIPILFEQETGWTLESIGCTVINVNGVAFRHFLTIIQNGFFKKCVVLTDSDTGTKTENRAASLKNDFDNIHNITIEFTKESTFEKDLIAANKSGDTKELLFDALSMTKPRNGPKFKKGTGDKDIDVSAFFNEIEDYKAEFAFSLVTTVTNEPQRAEQEKRQVRELTVPPYILDAFTFIQES